MKIYYKKNTGKKGVPKWGIEDKVSKKKIPLDLDYFTHYKTEINFKTIDENNQEVDSNQSVVMFRFHSEKAICEMTVEECIKKYGSIHVRYWVYNGTDKTEEELLEWALSTNDKANDGKTSIKGCQEV